MLDAREVRGLLAAGDPATELPTVRDRRPHSRADVAPRQRRSSPGEQATPRRPERPRSTDRSDRHDDTYDWIADLRGADLDADSGPLPSRPVVDAAPGGDPEPLLPPPSDEEMSSYRNRRLPVLLGASLVSFGSLMVSQVLFLRMSPWLWLFVPAMAFTVVYYLISLAVNVGTPGFDLARHRRLVAAWRPTRYPSVDVFLPVCGEALDVLDNTWRHVHRMATHYPGRVCVYVLDDSVSSEREEMALSYGYVYQRRPNRGWYKKAGNMRYAYQRTLGDHILVLDADFTPRADLLDQLLPYFDDEPDLGIVQSPQYFRVERRQGWLERGAAAVQELFYRSVQVSRQHHEAAICVGSCAIYRRTALDAIGGSTLIEHSEDVHTGFDMRRQGWRLRYVPVPLAVGLCPADLNSFFTQQYRWCAGSMSLLGSTKFWNLEMRLRQRLSYFSGFCYYAHTALFTFAGPLVPIVMLWFFPQYVRLEHYLLIVPSVLYNFAVFPLWHRTTYRFETWTVKLVYGWAHAFAIWDLLRGQTMGWQPTGSTAKKSRTRRLRVGIAVWSLGAALTWTLLAALRMRTVDIATFTPAFLAGTVFLATVLQALLVDPVRDVPGEEK
ncbi:glycosyltransferase [Micromonospora sp. R77]|uniref:glycosyltransferase family 2 protein n=1 Tax=Micromonospora sp. R77 TaxID=2925836 RepID=UPI001F618CB5|nr:cellulose synthase catalytic subunit [Micromonospora sp. R77]MCI4065054.1 glycosyltransferase [Micromonospora sp. R77]